MDLGSWKTAQRAPPQDSASKGSGGPTKHAEGSNLNVKLFVDDVRNASVTVHRIRTAFDLSRDIEYTIRHLSRDSYNLWQPS
jgi:hypothetical protein